MFTQVRGWTRVAPLSSLFISPKRSKNRTTKRADSPSRQSVEPVLHNTDTPAKKPPETIPSSTPWSGTTAAPLVPAVSESPMFDAFWRNMPEMLPEESPKKKGSHKDSSAKSKLTKNLKSLPRSLNTVVPIKQFTFLPPIEELQLNPHLINEQILPQRISEGDSSEKSCFAMDKKGGTKGTRLDSVTNHEPGLYPKLHLAQCNSQLLSAFSVSIPGRYPVSVSSNQMQPSSLGRRTIYSSSGTNDVAPMYALSL